MHLVAIVILGSLLIPKALFLKCYTCKDYTCNIPSYILPQASCAPGEDRCFTLVNAATGHALAGIEKATGHALAGIEKGCTSKSECVLGKALASLGNVRATCCEGDLCNKASATSTAVSVFLLLAVPVVSAALFH